MINTTHYENLTWIDIKDPREKDIHFLAKKFHFIHRLVLDEIIPPGHRAKVERHKDYFFLVLYYPIFNQKEKKTEARELDIIVTRTHVITSHYKTIIPIKKLFDHINLYEEKKKEYMSEGPGPLLYHIINGLLNSALNKLEYIEKDIDMLEEAIFSGKEKAMVLQISETKRDIINFRRILAPQSAVLESLHTEGVDFFSEKMHAYLEDLLGNYSIVWNTVEDQLETVQALGETNDSLLSNKTNEIVKLLTIFSVIVFPLTLLSSIWGMNTEYIPFNNLGSPQDFWAVMGLMGILSAAMLVFFKRKGWF